MGKTFAWPPDVGAVNHIKKLGAENINHVLVTRGGTGRKRPKRLFAVWKRKVCTGGRFGRKATVRVRKIKRNGLGEVPTSSREKHIESGPACKWSNKRHVHS